MCPAVCFSNIFLCLCCCAVVLLALQPHSKKVVGSIWAWNLSVCSPGVCMGSLWWTSKLSMVYSTLPLLNGWWDRPQLTPVTLSLGTSEYRRWRNKWKKFEMLRVSTKFPNKKKIPYTTKTTWYRKWFTVHYLFYFSFVTTQHSSTFSAKLHGPGYRKGESEANPRCQWRGHWSESCIRGARSVHPQLDWEDGALQPPFPCHWQGCWRHAHGHPPPPIQRPVPNSTYNPGRSEAGKP